MLALYYSKHWCEESVSLVDNKDVPELHCEDHLVEVTIRTCYSNEKVTQTHRKYVCSYT